MLFVQGPLPEAAGSHSSLTARVCLVRETTTFALFAVFHSESRLKRHPCQHPSEPLTLASSQAPPADTWVY